MADDAISLDWPTLLREFRKARGLKQAAAAAVLGVAQSTISRWELGKGEPSVAMGNRLIKELLRDRLPPDAYKWVSTFRRLPFPAAVISENDVAQAVTSFLAAKAGVSPEAIEGLEIKEIFEGEALDLSSQVREAGLFSGRALSFEACVRLRFSPRFKDRAHFNVHFVAWPHVTEDGRIVIVNEGVVLSDEEARRVRRRLGGPIQFQLLDNLEAAGRRARRS